AVLKRGGVAGFGNINLYPFTMGADRPDVVLGANIETLNRKRSLMPGRVQIRHKHADLQILRSHFLLLDTHETPQKSYYEILPIVPEPRPVSITFLQRKVTRMLRYVTERLRRQSFVPP